MVTDLIIEMESCWCKTGMDIEIKANSVILTNGTFLNGTITLVRNNLVAVEQERGQQQGLQLV